ncbi:hypothetical protein FB451DRAFT_1213635 [Mycena latifolia]|nr:hypothetical protein FB451DRAFT_1213635 [Mycena latifolia]
MVKACCSRKHAIIRSSRADRLALDFFKCKSDSKFLALRLRQPNSVVVMNLLFPHVRAAITPGHEVLQQHRYIVVPVVIHHVQDVQPVSFERDVLLVRRQQIEMVEVLTRRVCRRNAAVWNQLGESAAPEIIGRLEVPVYVLPFRWGAAADPELEESRIVSAHLYVRNILGGHGDKNVRPHEPLHRVRRARQEWLPCTNPLLLGIPVLREMGH